MTKLRKPQPELDCEMVTVARILGCCVAQVGKVIVP